MQPITRKVAEFYNRKPKQMKKLIVRASQFIAVFIIFFASISQYAKCEILTVKTITESLDSVYLVVDQMPEFQGGRRGLASYINQNLKYPDEAKRLNIKGKVYVKFIVDNAGKVKEPALVRKGNPILDAEALRIVRQMPTWKPGKHGGEQVNVSLIVTISFPPKR